MGDVISGKNLIPESFPGATVDLAAQIGLLWDLIKAPLIVPLLQLAVYICLAMTVMLFLERLYMGIVIILIKLFWKKPDKRYNWEPIRDDLEIGNSAFPLVLIQIPMFNEKEVCFFFFIVCSFIKVFVRDLFKKLRHMIMLLNIVSRFHM